MSKYFILLPIIMAISLIILLFTSLAYAQEEKCNDKS